MTNDCLYAEALNAAATESVETVPDTVVLYSISYQPTEANKEAALTFLRENPQMVMIDHTICGKRLIELGFGWDAQADENRRQQIAGIWRVASRRFIACASGNIQAFVDNADPRSVFVSEELPAILQNEKIVTVNGIDKYRFAKHFLK